jgi:AraC family transcriptional regulator of adaptative response/methylated-DNA-[protein]-cysteine methyltransferase
LFNSGAANKEKLNLLVQGTDFQVKVWEALINIPFGNVSSYRQVADQIGYVGSVRAVASAAGKNPVSYLIPCHRIIRGNGEVGNFIHGKIRKQVMIAWEMGKMEKIK